MVVPHWSWCVGHTVGSIIHGEAEELMQMRIALWDNDVITCGEEDPHIPKMEEFIDAVDQEEVMRLEVSRERRKKKRS